MQNPKMATQRTQEFQPLSEWLLTFNELMEGKGSYILWVTCTKWLPVFNGWPHIHVHTGALNELSC